MGVGCHNMGACGLRGMEECLGRTVCSFGVRLVGVDYVYIHLSLSSRSQGTHSPFAAHSHGQTGGQDTFGQGERIHWLTLTFPSPQSHYKTSVEKRYLQATVP